MVQDKDATVKALIERGTNAIEKHKSTPSALDELIATRRAKIATSDKILSRGKHMGDHCGKYALAAAAVAAGGWVLYELARRERNPENEQAPDRYL